jgi:hypothetical protein
MAGEGNEGGHRNMQRTECWSNSVRCMGSESSAKERQCGSGESKQLTLALVWHVAEGVYIATTEGMRVSLWPTRALQVTDLK